MSGHGQGPSTSKSPSGSGSQNPRSHLSSDPRWRQGASNPARSANATGNTDTSHPSSSTGIGSLPPRPTTVAKELSPRTAKPNYGYYRDSTLSSSMHIPPRQAIPGPTPNNAPLKVTATKTSSKPSLASKSAGSTRADDGTSGGGGGIGGTESLSQATPSRPRFQPPKVAGRPGDARVSPASGRIVSMDSISRAGLATTSNAVASKSMARHAPRVSLSSSSSAIPPSPETRNRHSQNPLSRYALSTRNPGNGSVKTTTSSTFASKSSRSTANAQISQATRPQVKSTPQKSLNRSAPRVSLPQSISAYSNTTPSKSSKPLGPLWQEQDAEFEHFLELKKRDRDGRMITASKRITSAPGGRRGIGAARSDVTATLSVDDPDRTTAQIAPNLKLHVDGEPAAPDEIEDEDAPRYRPQARAMLGKKIPRNPSQFAVKSSAARKVEYVDTSSESSSDSDDTMTSGSDKTDGPEPHEESGIDDSDAEQLDTADDDGDVVMGDVLEAPPKFRAPEIIPLDRDNTAPPAAPGQGPTEPSDRLVAAVEALTISSIRMQQTSQLPFLLRNLRFGFLLRCRRLQVPVYSDGRDLFFSVHYSYLDDAVYQVDGLSVWLCPLCNLLGRLKTREMLDCHLHWDHPEVYFEWKNIDETPEKESWQLQILIPELLGGNGDEETDARAISPPTQKSDDQPNSMEVQAGTQNVLQTPSNRSFSSPFPSVSLSPPSVRREIVPPGTPRTPTIRTTKVESKREDWASIESATTISSRGRSSTADGSTATATTSNNHSISTSARSQPPTSANRSGCHPDPPPADNPLGPAAQPPYLPAESEYGGPTVYYSCRPSGPCLFDLLGTLPMEPYGILDWQILDVEDEIYECDDVREEYKVMHALWARWIFLNKNKLISNYLKGVIAFVDDYWRMIHRAAGWSALRYWCWMLAANKILIGREVAKVLLHYEELTGMASWCDDV